MPGDVVLEAPHSVLRFHRPRPDVVVLLVTGKDVGEHGTSPFRELGERMRIYTDPLAFEDELAAFTQRAP